MDCTISVNKLMTIYFLNKSVHNMCCGTDSVCDTAGPCWAAERREKEKNAKYETEKTTRTNTKNKMNNEYNRVIISAGHGTKML